MEFMHISELSRGMAFPEYEYTLSEDIIKKYLEAVEAGDPLYGDAAYAKGQVFGHIIVPPTSISIYVTPSRVLRTLGEKPPAGLIQTGQRFGFYNPIEVGETCLLARIWFPW